MLTIALPGNVSANSFLTYLASVATPSSKQSGIKNVITFRFGFSKPVKGDSFKMLGVFSFSKTGWSRFPNGPKNKMPSEELILQIPGPKCVKIWPDM